MVWDGGSKPLVVPTRWALLRVALGGAPVWPSSGGVGFTEKSVVRRPPCYLPLEQLEYFYLDLSGSYTRREYIISLWRAITSHQ